MSCKMLWLQCYGTYMTSIMYKENLMMPVDRIEFTIIFFKIPFTFIYKHFRTQAIIMYLMKRRCANIKFQ